ncbi:hypothetical protein O181_047448 [Austropuccinia psidii MF-1]|uniref:Uncharacterized protein n=1 Tax=Austropuccinia psidii MF-1 TaxID=1389203 RepID=A0A9Q3DW23_9BASI|nr:hypothetical protein [Austropuccinia psidii MF-1]
MHPVLKDAGLVHIWYYIPLCTIFAQQSNGDFFRTQFHDSKERSQNPSPILKEDSSSHQSGNPWWLSEDHFRTPTTWPCRSWVGNSSRIIPRAILRGYSSFNQFSRQQVLNTPWTTQLIHTGSNQSTCRSLAQLGQFILHCGDSITQFNFQDGQNCIGPIQTIQPDDSPSRISSQFFTYTAHLSSPGDFFPS